MPVLMQLLIDVPISSIMRTSPDTSENHGRGDKMKAVTVISEKIL